MPATTEVLRSALTRFVPCVLAVMAGLLLFDGLRSRAGLASLRHVSWLVFGVEAAAMGIGHVLVLLIMCARLRADAVAAGRRSMLAAGLAVVLLGAVSVLSQGARMPALIGCSVAAGALATLVVFSRGASGRATTA